MRTRPAGRARAGGSPDRGQVANSHRPERHQRRDAHRGADSTKQGGGCANAPPLVGSRRRLVRSGAIGGRRPIHGGEGAEREGRDRSPLATPARCTRHKPPPRQRPWPVGRGRRNSRATPPPPCRRKGGGARGVAGPPGPPRFGAAAPRSPPYTGRVPPRQPGRYPQGGRPPPPCRRGRGAGGGRADPARAGTDWGSGETTPGRTKPPLLAAAAAVGSGI